MKIESIKFDGHPVLGDLFLDFTDPDTDEVFHTVIFAGENGVGKSLILEEVYSVFEPNLQRNFGKVTIKLQLDETNLNELRNILDADQLTVKNKTVEVQYEYKGTSSWQNIKITFVNENGDVITRASSDFFNPPGVRRPFRIFYSEASVGFNAPEIQSTKASELDQQVVGRRSGDNLGAQISQLLVDIRAADNEDAMVWVESHPQSIIPEELKSPRMDRFRNAIEYIFPKKFFKTVSRANGQYTVDFEEHGKVTSLNQLSTGEKQIIFRGGFVLRDLGSIQGGVLLIDEPELSLHPGWQAKIVGFYQRLLPQKPKSTTQLIVATHSPFIVHDQMSAKVIILKKDPITGMATIDPEPAYPTTGQARIVKSLNIAGLVDRAQHEIIVFVEGETDKEILDMAWQNLYPGETPFFELRPAYSHKAIRTILNDGQVFSKNPLKKLVGLFDFDSAYAEWNGTWRSNSTNAITDAEQCLTRKHNINKGWSMLLPVPSSRSHLASEQLGGNSALSIEFLFDDKDHIPGMIEQIPLPAPNAYKPKMKDAMKVSFATHVSSLPATSFESFRPIFERLRDIQTGKI